jgi:hypothetical protein
MGILRMYRSFQDAAVKFVAKGLPDAVLSDYAKSLKHGDGPSPSV